jgi:hypothetical protein
MLTTPFAKPDVRTAWRLVDSLQTMVGEAPGNFGGRRFQVMAAAVIARAGLADSARRVLLRNRATEQEDPEHELQQFEIYARVILNDRDEAFRLLKSTLSSNPEHMVSIDKVGSWWWRPLKSDPRFREITRPVD